MIITDSKEYGVVTCTYVDYGSALMTLHIKLQGWNDSNLNVHDKKKLLATSRLLRSNNKNIIK